MSKYDDNGHRYVLVPWSALEKPNLIQDLGLITDPGADKLLFWDDSESAFAWTDVVTGTPGTLSADFGLVGGGDMSTNISVAVDDTVAHDWTAAHTFASTVSIDGAVTLGSSLVINDATDADTLTIALDGTDANITAAGLTDVNVSGYDGWLFQGTYLEVNGAAPRLRMYETGATADEGRWEWRADADELHLYTLTDAGAAVGDPIALTRTGTTVPTMTLTATTIDAVGDVRVRTGNSLTVWDPGNTDYVEISNDGTDAFIDGTSTRYLRFRNYTTGVQVDGGIDFSIADTTGSDKGTFDHDGTDFNLTCTGTTDFNITGLTALKVGNYTFNVDQTVGAGQDNYVLTYDNATGEIGLEAGGAGSSPLTTNGDLYYYNAGDARLPIGTAGQVLTVSGGFPAWAAASGGSSASKTNYETAVAALSPVSFYKMDEASGNFVDSGSAALNLTATGTITYRAQPIMEYGDNGAPLFAANAGGTQSSLPITAPWNGDYTLECIATTFDSTDLYLLGVSASGETEATNFQALWSVNAGVLRLFWEYGAGTNADHITKWGPLEGVKYHLAVVKDGTANDLTFYVNGNIMDIIAYSNEPTGGSSATMQVGVGNTTDSQVISHFAIYNSTLTTAQIKEHAVLAGCNS